MGEEPVEVLGKPERRAVQPVLQRGGVVVTLNTLVITNGVRNNLRSQGGGIANNGGMVTLNDSTISNNHGNSEGGGVYNNGGTVTLNGSSSVSNNTHSGGPLLLGGGIFNDGTLNLNDTSTVSSNTATGGGGIDNEPDGTVNLHDTSTVSSNTVGEGGGGVLNDGTLNMTGSSTITGNHAISIPGGSGGGICNSPIGTLNGAVPGTGGNVFGNTPDDIFHGLCPI